MSALVRPSDSPLVFALDFSSSREAEAAAEKVAGGIGATDAIGMVKVGLELFVEEGPRATELAKRLGLPLFLDLKLHDIPETVERAVARAAQLGASLLTVHASGGPAMLARAVERAAREGGPMTIAAVTVLTSLDDADLAAIGYARSSEAQVVHLAEMAFAAGVRAFVCSPREVAALRAKLGSEAILVVPGVRPAAGSSSADQKRIATPSATIRAGADWLVVGRPIRDAADPRAAALSLAADAREGRVASPSPSSSHA
jgi:orotidine-5'-phosphate decarboxylase